MVELRASANDERQFTIRAYEDTHVRFKNLTMVYTNDPMWVENSIHTMEQLLVYDKYKVAGFDLEYTGGRVGHDQKVAISQHCVCHYVLVYHYCMATRPCDRFARFVNIPDYIFGTVDTTNNEKVLKTTGLACRNLVDIQCVYKILGGEEKHKDSLVDLAMAIINPYYKGMKGACKKNKVAWHHAWVRRLDEDHVKYVAKDAYVSYKMCRCIVDMRKFLHPAPIGTPRHKKYR